MGSQTGGSITRPAAFCGVCGCKPTFGRVTTAGVCPVALSLDHLGPIARSVADLAILLDAIVDDGAMAGPSFVPPRERAPPPRMARLRGLFAEKAQPDALHRFDRALVQLTAAGAEIFEVQLPPAFAEVLVRHRVVMAAEMAAHHEQSLAEHGESYLPRIRSVIEEGRGVAASEYIRCRRHQGQLRHEMQAALAQCDALICPAATGPAPDRTTTGDPCFNSPWSYTGLPTVSFPCGLSAEGLPLAIQLVGRPRGERDLFAASAWCEAVLARQAGDAAPVSTATFIRPPPPT
jgi:aspartyl-tRNA(Asn)/glutamyl-tRNA(Gln) amidotransferase subunit A